MRRLLPLLGLLVVLAGCGGTQTADQKARKEFLFKYPDLNDQKLARLCPALYPTDFLARPKHYHYTRDKKRFVPTAEEVADAKRVPGCKGPGTKPK